jgi:hypothetical protein
VFSTFFGWSGAWSGAKLCGRFVTYNTVHIPEYEVAQSGKIDVTSTNDGIFQFCKKIVIVKVMSRSVSM